MSAKQSQPNSQPVRQPQPTVPHTPRPDESAMLPAWVPLLIMAVTVAAVLNRLVRGESLFWGLPSLQFYPWQEFALAELRAGRLPLWNPFNGAGAPLLANYQSAVFYPPHLLAILSGNPGAMGISAALHLLWAGYGMWSLLRALHIGGLGQGIGVLGYALNTAVVARLGTLPMVYAASWLPWIIFAAEQVLRRAGIRALLLFTFSVALLLLAGHAQWAFYILVLAGLYILYRLPRLGSRQRRTAIGLAALGVLLGAGLAGMQLLPTAELQRQSQRSGGVEERFALNYSYELPLLPTLLQPDFYGNPGRGDYAISGAYFETTAYIGLLPAIAAFAAVIQTLRRQIRRLRRRRGVVVPLDAHEQQMRGLIGFFAIVAAVSFLFALGRNFAPYVFLFRYVPTFSLFQAPARWLLLTVFSLSMVAALGASLWRPDRYFLVRARLLLFAALILLLIGVIGATAAPGALTVGVRTLAFWLTGCAALLLAWPNAARNRPGLRRWTVFAFAFIAIDLGVANFWSNPTVSPDFYAPRPSTEASAGRTYRPDDQVQKIQFDQFLRFDDYRVAVDQREAYRASGLANLNLLDRQPSMNTFEPLRPTGIDLFLKLIDAHPAPNLAHAAAIRSPGEAPPPRAWIAPTVIGSSDPFRAMADPSWDPYTSALLEGDAPTFRGAAQGTVSIVHDGTQQVVLSVASSGQAALVLADTWYPGWVATINGSPAPMYRANGAFRAVIIPAGTSQVEFRYEPAALRAGVALSAAAALGCGALVLTATYGAARRRRQPPRQPAQRPQ